MHLAHWAITYSRALGLTNTGTWILKTREALATQNSGNSQLAVKWATTTAHLRSTMLL